jgi:phosphatidylserine/phosphatidylglycerophosphate/cardiolipin synthase-like enzyme
VRALIRGLTGPLFGALTLALCLLPEPAAAAELPASGTVEVLFTPWDDAESAIVASLGAARRSIRVQAYAFTSRAIAEALVAAQRRGVEVAVLADAEMNRRAEGNRITTLLAAGIPVAFETRYNAAHNKVIVIDPESADCAVLSGSYNFTWSAQARNAENLLILRGNRALARRYLENWQRHRAEAIEIRRLPYVP